MGGEGEGGRRGVRAGVATVAVAKVGGGGGERRG